MGNVTDLLKENAKETAKEYWTNLEKRMAKEIIEKMWKELTEAEKVAPLSIRFMFRKYDKAGLGTLEGGIFADMMRISWKIPPDRVSDAEIKTFVAALDKARPDIINVNALC